MYLLYRTRLQCLALASSFIRPSLSSPSLTDPVYLLPSRLPSILFSLPPDPRRAMPAVRLLRGNFRARAQFSRRRLRKFIFRLRSISLSSHLHVSRCWLQLVAKGTSSRISELSELDPQHHRAPKPEYSGICRAARRGRGRSPGRRAIGSRHRDSQRGRPGGRARARRVGHELRAREMGAAACRRVVRMYGDRCEARND